MITLIEGDPRLRFHLHGADATRAFGKSIARFLQPGDVIAISGDLGAGKTTFTQGLANGLGISEQVNSPTFTIIKEYKGRLPLYHMDVYRLGGYEELGFEEYFSGPGVTVIEWPGLIEEELPDELLWIEIRVIGPEEREISISPRGIRYEQLCKEIVNEYSRH
jgi:tRNA threonylcarbamoyladenosine biosynthesis protein TsaE